MVEQSETENGLPRWRPTPYSIEQARQNYAKILPTVDLTGLTGWLTTQLQRGMSDDNEYCMLFGDALYEISRLIDELRFEVALATVYIREFDDKTSTRASSTDGLRGSFEVPRNAITLLSPPLEGGRLLSSFFVDPSASIAGQRTIAGWFTAQLLDSALIRAVAAIDCLPVLLWSAAETPMRTGRCGRLSLPKFCSSDLELVAFRYDSGPAWSNLCKLTEHTYMHLAVAYHDGFIHQRRAPRKLHGGRKSAITFGGHRSAAVMSADRQLKLVSNFICSVLHPAIKYTNQILSSSSRLAAPISETFAGLRSGLLQTWAAPTKHCS